MNPMDMCGPLVDFCVLIVSSSDLQGHVDISLLLMNNREL
jgi:hypothetical protein